MERRHIQNKPKKSLQFAGLTLDPLAYEVSYNRVALDIAGKEFSILELLLHNPRQVISRGTFYERVWNYDFDGGNSIEVYISYLRRKLNKVGAQGLLQTVRGTGYVLRERA